MNRLQADSWPASSPKLYADKRDENMNFFTNSGREIHYFGEEYGDIPLAGRKQDSVSTLNDLFSLLLKSWVRETAYPSAQRDPQYDRKNDPTYGQCAITAVIVYEYFGGSIHRIRIPGGGTHYFNRINGRYIDLTSDQFSLYGIPCPYEPNQEMDPSYCGTNPDTRKRLALLKANLEQTVLENHPVR